MTKTSTREQYDSLAPFMTGREPGILVAANAALGCGKPSLVI